MQFQGKSKNLKCFTSHFKIKIRGPEHSVPALMRVSGRSLWVIDLPGLLMRPCSEKKKRREKMLYLKSKLEIRTDFLSFPLNLALSRWAALGWSSISSWLFSFSLFSFQAVHHNCCLPCLHSSKFPATSPFSRSTPPHPFRKEPASQEHPPNTA